MQAKSVSGPEVPVESMLQAAFAALQAGQQVQAEGLFGAVLAFAPNNAQANHVLGMLQYQKGKPREAEILIRRAIAISADAAFLTSLANIQFEQKRYDEAQASYQQALVANPDFIDALNNLGLLHMESRRLVEAEACYRKALALRADSAKALNNLGVILQDTHRFGEAEDLFRRLLQVAPNNSETMLNLAILWLQTGDFARGWRAYEYRWQARGGDPVRGFTQPLWLGNADLRGKTILLYAEQGFGDTLQFLRYVPMVAAQGARVLLEVPVELKSLATMCAGVSAVFVRGTALHAFDYQCPLMSLPLAFNTSLTSIPANVPYLKNDAAKDAIWRGRLGERKALRVGLVWAGNPRQQMPRAQVLDRQRSIPFAQLLPLLNVDGVEFHSLQVEKDIAAQAQGHGLIDHTRHLRDFGDSAALIQHLDLVISVDTAVVHLAGALAKPVWLLNRYNTCWRWLMDREDSPWYPTMRLFRQPALGDWDSVIAQVRAELVKLAQAR